MRPGLTVRAYEDDEFSEGRVLVEVEGVTVLDLNEEEARAMLNSLSRAVATAAAHNLQQGLVL